MSYVTGISGNVISAASAGFAPTNSADVSAIASSYAESAVSSKLDSSAFADVSGTFLTSVDLTPYQTTAGMTAYQLSGDYAYNSGLSAYALSADVSGVIDTVSSNSASWTSVDSATISAIASSYAESAVSSKLDESATADFYSTSNPSSFVDSAYVDGAVSGKLDSSASSAFYPVDNPSGFITGVDLSDYATTGYVDSSVSGKLDSSASSSFYTVDNPSGFITGVDLSNYATTAYVDSSVSSKLDSSASSSFYTTANESGFVDSAYVDSAVSGKADSSALSSYALSSDVSGVIDTVSSNSASWGGGGAQIVTATGSARVGYGLGAQTAVSSINGSALLPYGFSAISGNSGNWNSTRTAVTANSANWNSVYNTVNSSSASWGGGGIDSATCSAIASSYAESAASSKMDSSAIDYTRTGNGTQIYASGTGSSTNQFSATNDSAGAAIIAGENARLRLWDTAATANLYASSIGGWNSVSNLVSTQSANWGGSALALSAGPGVKLELSGTTLVASTDETVLWSGSMGSGDTAEMSYPLTAFERIRITWCDWNSYRGYHVNEFAPSSTQYPLVGVWYGNDTGIALFRINLGASLDYTTMTFNNGVYLNVTGTQYNPATYSTVTQVVGVNRTAGV